MLWVSLLQHFYVAENLRDRVSLHRSPKSSLLSAPFSCHIRHIFQISYHTVLGMNASYDAEKEALRSLNEITVEISVHYSNNSLVEYHEVLLRVS